MLFHWFPFFFGFIPWLIEGFVILQFGIMVLNQILNTLINFIGGIETGLYPYFLEICFWGFAPEDWAKIVLVGVLVSSLLVVSGAWVCGDVFFGCYAESLGLAPISIQSFSHNCLMIIVGSWSNGITWSIIEIWSAIAA